MFAATKKSDSLSESALNYLQSLENATKALRQGQNITEKKLTAQNSTKTDPSFMSSENRSLSMMISQLRRRTLTDSIISESDEEKSISGVPSLNGSGKASSSATTSLSASGGERVVFDFPFDGIKDENKKNETNQTELPGLQMIQKNINEIRELRSTIDSSLIKPPELLRQQMRRQSTTSIRENFEHDDEKSGVTPTLNAIKKKSPFRMMVESGSDLESIDFNDDESPRESMSTKEQTASSENSLKLDDSSMSTASSSRSNFSSSAHTSETSTNHSRTSLSRSSGSSVKDDDMSGSSGSSTTGKSTIKSAGKHKKKTDQLTTHNKFPTAVQGKQEQNVERLPTSPEPESEGLCTSFSVQQGHRRQMTDRESDHQSSSIRHEPSYATEPTRMKSAITTKNKSNIIRNEEILCGSNSSGSAKQNRHYKELLERGTQTEMTQSEQHPEFCSTNVHHVLNEVLRTHLQLLREFNRLEWTSLQEWNSTLDEIRKNYDGPSSKKLQVIIDKYRKKYEQSQL